MTPDMTTDRDGLPAFLGDGWRPTRWEHEQMGVIELPIGSDVVYRHTLPNGVVDEVTRDGAVCVFAPIQIPERGVEPAPLERAAMELTPELITQIGRIRETLSSECRRAIQERFAKYGTRELGAYLSARRPTEGMDGVK